MEWYKYRLMIRGNDDGNDLHRFGRLFQQFVVDMYAKMESNRLSYIRQNQNRLRRDLYRNVADAVNLDDTNMASIGRRVILPSSFIGSPRHMQQLYQDAMSIVRNFGKPDLFITFTCNPNWSEIQNALLPGQTAADRPDLTTRVFRMKFKQLMEDLTKHMVLGTVIAHVHTIEYQKRGLVHAHILLILAEQDKPQTAAQVDNIVSAKLPDATLYPAARAVVERQMIHDSCAYNNQARCIQNGRCSKGYPKQYSEETLVNEDGYPTYQRPRNGDFVLKNNRRMTNMWVVPHNLFLCAKYNAHINVEVCSSIHSIKYVYKYVYKGHDRASVMIQQQQANTSDNGAQPVDEISSYLDARYVSASEGCWRLFSFPLHREFPAHQRLALHLEGEQTVHFNEDDDPATVASRAHETTLTAWFQFNSTNPTARTVLYPDFPEQYVFVQRTRRWKIRERGFGGTIGRVYNVSPRDVEKYHLRMLLYHVPGATSFLELRTVDGEEMPSFQAACRRRGLLAGQEEWYRCLEQATVYQMPGALRRLFATIIAFCNPEDPYALWMRYRDAMIEDFLHAERHALQDFELLPTDIIYGRALLDIESVLAGLSRSLLEFDGFVLPENIDQANNEPLIIRMHRQLAARLERQPVRQLNFNDDQQSVFDAVMIALNDTTADTPRLHFVNGSGGCGTTYLFNAIMETVRRDGGIAIAVASSGTAALLLDGGRTAHSTFKIPLEVSRTSTCSFTPFSDTGRLIRMATLIVWDEASMISRDVIETVNRSIQDLMRLDDPSLERVPFGGKVVVFGGDFRQVIDL